MPRGGAIFGLCQRGRAHISESQCRTLGEATGLVAAACARAFCEQGALLGSTDADDEWTLAATAPGSNPFVAVANAAIYNRSDLLPSLGLNDREVPDDGALLAAAYQSWGAAFAAEVIGDWSFAAWHPAERRLFLARDHSGNTSLYYYADDDLFAFSTSRCLLLDMRLAPIHLDELYLAQMLVSSPGYLGARTAHSTIRHVPPAHSLTVTPCRVNVQRYWEPENVPELHLPRREDYVAGLRDVLDRAVRESLPRSGTLAATLSGGLDSGSVSVMAAGALHDRGERLTAYTSVPLSDPSSYVGDNFGDEFHFASRTAGAAGNIDIRRIEARGLSPLQAIRSGIDICLEPSRGAAGLFWTLDLHKTAARDGHAALFAGQMGNGGISWTGDIFSQPLRVQTRHAGIRRALRHCGRTVLPKNVLGFFRRRRLPDWANTAIAPEFARRIRPLLEERPKFPWEASPHLARQQRVRLFRLTSLSGAVQAEIAAAYGLAVTDPTADPRVVSFCLSVPDRIFIDPESGIDRWLIREAMKGRLPDEVRLNRRRGRQSADLVPRLRACADEVESALDDVANGPAAAYVSSLRLRQAWDRVKAEDNQESFRCAAAVLARGIMAGLFVNGFGKTW